MSCCRNITSESEHTILSLELNFSSQIIGIDDKSTGSLGISRTFVRSSAPPNQVKLQRLRGGKTEAPGGYVTYLSSHSKTEILRRQHGQGAESWNFRIRKVGGSAHPNPLILRARKLRSREINGLFQGPTGSGRHAGYPRRHVPNKLFPPALMQRYLGTRR